MSITNVSSNFSKLLNDCSSKLNFDFCIDFKGKSNDFFGFYDGAYINKGFDTFMIFGDEEYIFLSSYVIKIYTPSDLFEILAYENIMDLKVDFLHKLLFLYAGEKEFSETIPSVKSYEFDKDSFYNSMKKAKSYEVYIKSFENTGDSIIFDLAVYMDKNKFLK